MPDFSGPRGTLVARQLAPSPPVATSRPSSRPPAGAPSPRPYARGDVAPSEREDVEKMFGRSAPIFAKQPENTANPRQCAAYLETLCSARKYAHIDARPTTWGRVTSSGPWPIVWHRYWNGSTTSTTSTATVVPACRSAAYLSMAGRSRSAATARSLDARRSSTPVQTDGQQCLERTARPGDVPSPRHEIVSGLGSATPASPIQRNQNAAGCRRTLAGGRRPV